jgi:glutamate synthase (NADPH/NADH) small chain
VELVDGRFTKVEASDFELEADFVFLAKGFVGPETSWITEQFGVELDPRSNVARDGNWSTNVPGVFVAGDMGRGQSLIVWAIAEGRSCAAAVDRHLMGTTDLPSPLAPTAAPLR